MILQTVFNKSSKLFTRYKRRWRNFMEPFLCPKCGKNLSDDETINGKCYGCGATFAKIAPDNFQNMRYQDLQSKQQISNKSSVGEAIKIIGKLIAIVGIIASVFCAASIGEYGGNGLIIFILGAIVSIVSAIFIYGFGEIICLLQSINQKLDK